MKRRLIKERRRKNVGRKRGWGMETRKSILKDDIYIRKFLGSHFALSSVVVEHDCGDM